MLPEELPLLDAVVDWTGCNFKARKLKGGHGTQYLTTALATALATAYLVVARLAL